jgi:hypothetical protein
MYKTDASGNVASLPAPAALGTEGYFSDGDPDTGSVPTELDQDWFNMLQGTLLAPIDAAGLAHSKTDYTQLFQAILAAWTMTDVGAANALAVAPPVALPAFAAILNGTAILVIPAATSTAPNPTLEVSGGAPTTITAPGGGALQNGAIQEGVPALFLKQGSVWWLLGISSLVIISYAGNPNGNVAGNAATATTPPYLVWDRVDNFFWICIQTGNAGAAVWTQLNRQVLTQNVTFYVSGGGSDSTGNGTSGAPWATRQHAANYILANIDLAGFTATIHIADGTYTDNLTVSAPFRGAVGAGSVVFSGSTSAIMAPTAGNAFTAQNGAEFSISGFTIEAQGAGGVGVLGTQGGQISLLGGHDFGPCTQAHIEAEYDAGVSIQAAYSITGGSQSHVILLAAGSLSVNVAANPLITLSGTPAFSIGFVQAADGGIGECYGLRFTGSATGPRYLAEFGGGIQTNGGGASFLPGSASGSAISPGWYN